MTRVLLALPVKDYEDAVQVASAQAELLDALITRDPDDYKGVKFAVFTPAAFLEQLAPN